MWYFISAFFGAVVGIFLLAIVSVNRKDEDYWRGFRDGRSYEKRMRENGEDNVSFWIDHEGYTTCAVCDVVGGDDSRTYFVKGYRTPYCPNCGRMMTNYDEARLRENKEGEEDGIH